MAAMFESIVAGGGGINSRFFHLRANQRKKKKNNKITQLWKMDGEVTDDPAVMTSATNDFYHDLYKSEGTNDMAEVLDH